eukprot:TRINITY_DN102334_c0_g1_i1.p1 TRINITY_DN102334_c0_g1~~TRINITY_DN102334_c0_g1_i1.p1  ORF type:complete len:518 (+),score=110.90 TRINITY_DN102334_c0_g1_i1:78-1556(+)
MVKALLPGTMQTIQDCTHFVLVAGTFVCGIQVVMLAAQIWHNFPSEISVKDCVALAFFARCLCYMTSIIGQFEGKLQEKQKQARIEKDNLTRSYNDLIGEMDSLLQKSAESSAGLAERSFESKRRDFQRFLERVKSKYSVMYSGTKKDSDQLLQQFKRFCINWLHVFQECSINPVTFPKIVVKKEEIESKQSIEQVADLLLQRLKRTEVKFITMQREQDQKILLQKKGEAKRLTQATGRDLLALPNSAAARSPTGTDGTSSKTLSWFRLGGPIGCYLRRSTTEDGYPKDFRFLCGQIIILSYEHFVLLLGMVAGFVLVIYDLVCLVGGMGHASTLVSGLIAEGCIMVMLLRFEELDVIQQLTREVQELSKQKEQLREQREKMTDFWETAQSTTELWLYRTVPRLDLYKEVHSQLEDEKDDLITSMSEANRQLQDLENKLGALEAWRKDGKIQTEEKKKFGKIINGICQEQDLTEVLTQLETSLNGNALKLGV